MSRQHEVVSSQTLLNSRGILKEPGWARSLVWKYNRDCIKAPQIRRKEWDYYLITGERYGVAFTISDLGYAGLISASFIDFKEKQEHTESVVDILPMGKRYGLGEDSADGYGEVKTSRVHMRFMTMNGKRRIQCEFKNFLPGKNLSADFVLYQKQEDSMCIATPWEEVPTAFYYNQKINCMPVIGKVKIGKTEFRFKKETDFAVLDWGRGVWTYDNTWYWGTGSGLLNEKRFGFNIGYGFSDRTYATENMVFYDGMAHKLDEVMIHIPKDASGKEIYTGKDWKITSNDGRMTGVFAPILDRADDIDLKVIRSDQHQTFGYFTGEIILDDGTMLKPNDFLCAIEKVHNKY